MNTQRQQRRNQVAQWIIQENPSNAEIISQAEKLDLEEAEIEIRSGRPAMIVYEECLEAAIEAGDALIAGVRQNPPPQDSEQGRLIFYLAEMLKRQITKFTRLSDVAYTKLLGQGLN
jgi:hypothetical protein